MDRTRAGWRLGGMTLIIAPLLVSALLPAASSAAPLMQPEPSPTATGEPPSEGSGGDPATAISPYRFEPRGMVIDHATMGESPGPNTGASDASGALLPDGRIRLYFGSTAASFVRSAVSENGVDFTVEAGARSPELASQPRIIRAQNTWWLFYFIDGGIGSSRSSDGLTFEQDPGLRITKEQAGVTDPDEFLTTGSVVPIEGGGYRMYFSTTRRAGTGVHPEQVLSATSSDLLTWTMDDGTRVGEGAEITNSAEHPFAIANADGSVTLLYGSNIRGPSERFGIYGATSSDGLKFDSEFDLGIEGALDADVVERANGSLLVYYGFHSEETGNSIHVGKLTPVPTSCSVPNVRRKRLAVAKGLIEEAGCALGTVSRVYSGSVGRGRVISQRPLPGAERDLGGRVAVVVSRGPR